MNIPFITVGINRGLRPTETQQANIVMLCTSLYREVYDEESDSYVPPCCLDDDVDELCEYSEHSGYILGVDAVNTEDGVVHESEEVIHDESEYYTSPILESRRHEYNMVGTYDGQWVTTDCDEVYYGYVRDGRQDYFYDPNNDDVVYDDSGNSYRNSDIANNMGLSYSSRAGCYTKQPVYVFSYHAGSDKDCTTDSTVWSFGVEVEKEDEYVRNSISAEDMQNDTGWIKEEDGSLNYDEGYELTSPIYDLFDLSALQKDLENDDVRRHINAEYSDNCGGHFNISHKQLTSKQIYSAMMGFFPLLYALYPSRVSRDYCKAKCKFEMGYSPEKRSAFYIKSSRIFEIRLFPAVRNVENLLWRIRLMQIVVDNLNASEDKVLRLLLNPKSKLNQHLRKMYDNRSEASEVDTKMLELCMRFVDAAKRYNHMDLTSTYEKVSKTNNKKAA
jgi:hypothetical protein